MATRKIVHLRIYKGAVLNYDANGKVRNENQLVKLTFLSREWLNYLKYLKANSIFTVKIEKVFTETAATKNKKVSYKETDSFKDVEAALKEATSNSADVKGTPKSPLELENEILKNQLEEANNTDNDSGAISLEDLGDYTLSGLEKKFPEVAKNGYTTREAFIEELTKEKS